MSNGQGVMDAPIMSSGDDRLGLNRYADALGNFALQCDTPITVGIQGDWGSGKTSLMNLIDAKLRAVPTPPLTITLNTWQYAQVCDDGTLALSLLSALHHKVAGSDKGAAKLWSQLQSSFPKLKSVTVFGIGIETKGDGGGGIDLSQVKQQFEELVQLRLKKEGANRLVIFIDDLDRVLPARAVEILEVLKNFVDVPDCVFVIACDYAVITKGLKAKFDVDAKDLGGRSFFDKIIQVPFRMPVHSYEVGFYIEAMLKRIQWVAEPDDIQLYERLLATSIGFNPRSLKRLCNTLLLLRNVAGGSGEGAAPMIQDAQHLRILFALVCMESAFENEYRKLARTGNAELRGFLTGSDDVADESEGDERFPPFLSVLRETVDANRDNELSDEELAVLRQMISLSAITSVTDNDYDPDPSIEAHLQNARRLGTLDRLMPFLTLTRTLVSQSILTERALDRSIVFDLASDQERWGEDVYGGALMYVVPEKARVRFRVKDLKNVNTNEAVDAFLDFEYAEPYTGSRKGNVTFSLNSVDASHELVTELRKLQPFSLA